MKNFEDLRTFIQVDLETLSLRHNAVVLQIGAVAYKQGLGIFSEFDVDLQLDPQIDKGRHIKEDALVFWLQQGSAAREAITAADRMHHDVAKMRFSGWFHDVARYDGSRPEQVYMSSFGIDFDIPILSSLFDYDLPWKYRNMLCMRTVYNNYNDEARPLKAEYQAKNPNMIPHSAIWDARSQATMHLRLMANHQELV